tara:strand:- start:27726 stop:28508 length:783 start_codon:yes stop_codon:yes gene_type:complete
MNKFLILLLCLVTATINGAFGQSNDKDQDSYYQKTVIQLLQALKAGQDGEAYQKILEASTEKELEEELDTDPERFAFWVNLYNAYIQIRLSEKPEYYEDRSNFFSSELIHIAGRDMSFEDIEHGIIRGSQSKFLLGYFKNPFVKSFKKKFRPETRDYRIHFALNCGAKSCPPVAIYQAEKLDEQFDKSSKLFLEKFSSYDVEENQVNTSSLLLWFIGDFGGLKGSKVVLMKYGIIPNTDVDLEYDSYDWTLALGNYIELD